MRPHSHAKGEERDMNVRLQASEREKRRIQFACATTLYRHCTATASCPKPFIFVLQRLLPMPPPLLSLLCTNSRKDARNERWRLSRKHAALESISGSRQSLSLLTSLTSGRVRVGRRQGDQRVDVLCNPFLKQREKGKEARFVLSCISFADRHRWQWIT